MPERIDDPSEAPSILIADGRDYLCPRYDSLSEGHIWILHNHHHPRGATSERFRAEIQVLWRLVCDPESGPSNRQLSNYLSGVVVDAEQHLGSECSLVEVDCVRTSPDGKHRRNGNAPKLVLVGHIGHSSTLSRVLNLDAYRDQVERRVA